MQRAPLLVVVAIGLGVTVLAGQPTPSDPDATELDARTIMDRALERAAWAQEQNFAAQYRYEMRQRTREYDEDGSAVVDELRHYAVAPHRGEPYATLLTKDGESLSEADQAEEVERWEEFLESLDQPEDEDEDDGIAMEFDEDLVERFTATVDGVRDLHGRPTYVLTFEPRPGRLPVRRRTDHALNNSRGTVWIDKATYEVALVSFELMKQVRLWWGLLGSISDATGFLERRPVEPGGPWLSSELDVYYHVRVLFSTTRRGQHTVWDRFEPIEEEEPVP